MKLVLVRGLRNNGRPVSYYPYYMDQDGAWWYLASGAMVRLHNPYLDWFTERSMMWLSNNKRPVLDGDHR